MPFDATVGVVSHAIQLAIAPVFLLTGFAGLLGVMATRLARVIDRARVVEAAWPSLDPNGRAKARREMHSLEHRRRVCSWSITFCTAAALLVCVVIVILFAEEFLAMNLSGLISVLFVGAMVVVICGLGCFLREVYIATHATSIELARFE